MVTFIKKSFLVSASLCVAGALGAQNLDATDDFSDDDIIVVSAGKIEQSIDSAVEKVEVISSEDIQTSGAKTLSEAVKNLPGVTVTGASAANPVDSISMQGFDASYVKILVDGIAVSGDIGGSTAVFEIPVEMIDHIEVVQGASSALYGSDAMGGVINIITKKTTRDAKNDDSLLTAGDITFSANLTEEFSYMKSGNWRNYTSGTLSGRGEHLSGSLTGSYDYTPGAKDSAYYALAGGYLNYYETPTKRLGYLRGTLDWSDGWGKLGAYGLYASSDQKSNFTAAGFNTGTTMEYATDRMEGGISGEYKYDNTLSFSGFTAVKQYLLDTIYDVQAGSSSSVTDTASSFIDWESELRASYQATDMQQFLFGVNGTLETINGDSFTEREKQLLLSLYAQDTLTLFDGSLSLVPGFRADLAPAMGDSDTQYMLTPKFSVRYAPFDQTVIRFSYGMGYKTPTLKQKYWVFYHNYASGEGNFILYGNPDLKSEKSQSFNLSLEQKLGSSIKLEAGGYFNYVKDMITSVVTDASSSPQIRTYENVDKAITYGANAGVSYKYSRFDAKLGYAYTVAKAYNDDTDEWEDMTLKVTHSINASAGCMIPVVEAKLSINGQWNSKQLITQGGSDYTPDYLMLSATLSKLFWEERVEAYVRGDNLLNNKSFTDGTDGTTQEDYYGLYDGITVSVGARIKI